MTLTAPAPPAPPAGGAPPAAPGAPVPGAKRRRPGRIILWILAIIVVLALAATGFGAWTVARSFPQANGELAVSGLAQPVSVQRDALGIPTITAETSDDLFFAQGFVHAQDRFWEMDFRRHLTSARLSELFGESQVGTDSFLRTLGWRDLAEQEVAQLPPETLAYYEAYAAGVNAYLAERSGADLSLEYAVLGLQNADYAPEPWTPADSVAWFKAMAWDLRTNIEDETARALLAQGLDEETLATLYPDYPFAEHPVILADDPAGAHVDDPAIPAPRGGASGGTGTGTGASTAEAGTAASGSTEASNAEASNAGASGAGAISSVVSAGQAAAASAAVPALAELGTRVSQVNAMISEQGEGIGSNSWVVSGEHTESGKPLLANDPHLGAALPSVWTQMQLRCATVGPECPFEVAGFSFAGLPGIVIGHNQDIAWGLTNLTTDVADLYVERIEADGYWQDGEKHPFETRTETIKVAGGDPVDLEIRATGHGPIVSGLESDFTAISEDPRVSALRPAAGHAELPHVTSFSDPATEELPPGEFALSLQWTALEVSTTAQAIFTLNLAQDFSDFRLAAKQFDVPAQNLVYADREGNIGYQAPGKLPIRGAGDGWLPQPGWDSAFDWQGAIPFEELPTAYNPESGVIVTANNAIVTDDYRYFLSRDWDTGYRAARIQELLDERIEDGPLTAADMTAIHMDNRFPAADSLQRAFTGLSTGQPEVDAALELLADWDGQNDPDSAAAAFANVLWREVTAQLTDEQAVPIARDDQSRLALVFAQLLDAPDSEWWRSSESGLATTQQEFLALCAERAVAELNELQGNRPERWNWGELHALPLTHGTFGTSGIAPIEWLFNRGPVPTGGGSGVVNATGWNLDEGYATSTVPSMRMVLDLADWDASTWQNLTGASGHAFHPNYTDQSAAWASGEPGPWGFSASAVDASSTDELRLVPSES
ncbi:penicillin acylase family protein [Leucobacter sp. PH1c]|uniref:penicillin acylase family protein n=1 Tax=Leucobacter sp. PH1c TaxID=1397278 RepID=UPI00046830CC|nr:penicillin acylase family protein [Leucobacter sp. PH1c]